MSLLSPSSRHFATFAKTVAVGTASLALATAIAPANLTFDLRASAIQPEVGMLSSDGKAITLSGNTGTVTLQVWAQLTNTAPTSDVFGMQNMLGSIVSTSSAQPLLSGALTPTVAEVPFNSLNTPGAVTELSSPADGILDVGSNASTVNVNFVKFRKDPTSNGTQVGAVFFASNQNPAGATVNPITNGFEFLMGTTKLSIESFSNLQGSLSLNWKIPVFTSPINRGQIAQWTDGDGAVNTGNAQFAELSVGPAVSFTAPGLSNSTSWIASGNGSWAQRTNWSAGVPDSPLSIAFFASSNTSPATVTLDGDKTVNGITLTSGNAYTIAQGSGGALTVTGAIQSSGGNHVITAPVVIPAGSASVTVNNSDVTFTISGPVSGMGGLIKAGAGRLSLSGANTLTGEIVVGDGLVEFNSTGANAAGGDVNITGGTLRLLQANQIADTGTLSIDSGRLDLNGRNETVAGVKVLGGSLTGSGSTLTSLSAIDAQDGNVAITLAGNVGLTKTSSGTVTLNLPNNYTGLTSVKGGTLELAATGGDAIAGNVEIAGGTLRLLAANQIPNNRTLTLTSGVLDLGPFSETVGSIRMTGGTLTGVNADLTSLTDFNLDGGTVGANLTGNVGLHKTPGLTLTLSGVNTYTGATTVSSGQLIVATDRSLPAGQPVILGGGTLNLSGSGLQIIGSLSGSGSVAMAFEGGLVLGADNGSGSFRGPISGMQSDLAKIGSGEQILDLQGVYTGVTLVSGGRLILRGTSNSREFIAQSGGILRFEIPTLELGTKSVRADAGGAVEYRYTTITGGFLRGPGSHVVLAGTTSEFSGSTSFSSTRLLQNGETTLTNFTNGGEINNAAPLLWDGGTNTSSGRLNINSRVNAQDWTNDGLVTIRNGGLLSSTGSNLVSGGGSRLTLEPGGRLTLGNGTALDLQGSLLVNNGTVSGKTNVHYGATAKGDGVFGAVSVFDGGKFAPGNSPGTATIDGTLEWAPGGIMDFEIADALGTAGSPTGWDLARVIGASGFLAVNAGTTSNSRFTLRVVSFDANSPSPAANFDNTSFYQWLLAETSQGVTGFNANEIAIDARDFVNPLGGGSFAIAEDGRNVYLNFRPVPEPSALALLLGALSLGGIRRRRS